MSENERIKNDGGYGGFALSPNYINETKINLDDKYLKIIKSKLGVNNMLYLDSGEFGDAYKINHDKVLKLTTDRSEALESQKIKGKQNKNLANIYNVFEIKYKVGGDIKQIYAILSEYLKTDVEKYKKYIETLNKYFREKYDIVILDILDYYHFDKNKYNNLYRDGIDEFLKNNTEEGDFLKEMFNIIDELNKNNIQSADYCNLNNIGEKNNGRYGFFDLGFGDESGKIENIINLNEDGTSLYRTKYGYNGDLVDERKLSYMDNSNIVSIKDKCKLGGLGNTSEPCNQGDINNIELKKISEEETIDNFSGCIMLILDIPKWNTIISKIKTNDIFEKPYDNSFGIEIEPHITIKYGLSDKINYEDIFKFINEFVDDKINFKIKGIDLFQNEEFDVLKFNVESDELTMLNNKISENFEYVDRYKGYKPHITIAYLKSGSGKKYLNNINKDILFSASMLKYSNKTNNIKEFYNLNKKNTKFVVENNNLNEDTMKLNSLPFIDDIKKNGGNIYAVGGIVRDEILGKESKDLDILITGVPMDKIEEIVSKYGKVDSVGKHFGILKFRPEGYTGEDIDIAIPRTEKPTGEGGHKGFEVVSDHNLSIEDDLLRRDFKINAIAKDLDGNIIDPFGGMDDLKNKRISMVNPDAFSDDPLRMLRAIQFASRFNFEIEDTTLENIRKNAYKIKEIPPERVLIEFDKIINKGDIQSGVTLLKLSGLLKNIIGKDGGILVSNKWDNVNNIGEFIYLLTNHLLESPSEFFRKNMKGDVDNINIIKALEFINDKISDNDIQNRVLIFNAYKISPSIIDSKILPDNLYKTINEFKNKKYPLTNKEININGNDLMNLGLTGKVIGEAMRKILINIYADKLQNNKDLIINFIKNNYE